jgi:hypothetical protein
MLRRLDDGEVGLGMDSDKRGADEDEIEVG